MGQVRTQPAEVQTIANIVLPRACDQLSQMMDAARYIPPRKAYAVLSYLVAIALNCFSFWNIFSTRCLHLYIS